MRACPPFQTSAACCCCCCCCCSHTPQADLTFVLTDVASNAVDAFTQGVRVQWAQYQIKNQGLLLQNSGNPGYIPGLPVRVSHATHRAPQQQWQQHTHAMFPSSAFERSWWQ